MFRKRLMLCSWRFRKKVLESLRSFFSAGRSFDTATLDLDTANLRRDFVLMFGSPEEGRNLLKEETTYLPLNQSPSHHDRYGLLVELAKLRSNGPSLNSDLELSPSDQVSIYIADTIDYLKKNTLQVESDWLVWTLKLDGKKLGRDFTSPNVASAENFLEDLQKALAEEDNGHEISQGYQGFRVFDFMGLDPLILDPKSVEYEETLITFILECLYDTNNATALTLEKTDFGIPDYKSVLDEEK